MVGTSVLSFPHRSEVLVTVCCHCHRVQEDGHWQSRPVPPDRLLSHGICRECLEVYYPEYPLSEENL